MNHSHQTNFCVVILCLTFVVIGFGSLNAQAPDRQGWSNATAVHVDAAANQPVMIQASRIPSQIPDEVRDQIGLAVYEEATTETARFPNGNGNGNGNFKSEPVDRNHSGSNQSYQSQSSSSPLPDVATRSAPSTELALGSTGLNDLLSGQTEQLTSPDGIQSSIKVALLLATLSLAPAIVLMTTCYIRVMVVLSLLRQAFGGQSLPPTQVLTALSLFLTFLIMTPVWTEVKTTAIDPYTQTENAISWEEAWQRGVVPVKNFMIHQIELADNAESIELFYRYLPETSENPPSEVSEVPLNVLLPAFMISELKVAFLLGFQVYLPFLVVDLVVSSVTVSMGMLMLPPNMVSFPLKLILFVMVDGWNLVVGMLLQSFL